MRPTLRIETPPTVPPFLGAELNDDFFSDLDKAFEEIQMAPKTKSRTKSKRKGRAKEKNLDQMKETFVELAQVHLRPVLRYLKAVQLGVASKDLCEIVQYVVAPIIGKTRKVGLSDHAAALIRFERSLKKAVKGSSRKIPADQRTELARSFEGVRTTFDLEFRGHSGAVVNLLGFYRAIRKNKSVTQDDRRRLFAIGVASITMLRKSSVAELVSMSGIRPDKALTLRRHARVFNILSLL
ncbi:MAG: hypothetical protein V1495_10950 [Pseudomonadota bacterium]